MTSTAPGIDTRLHWAALVAAINAHEDDLPIYDWGKTPTTLPRIYALLTIERRYAPILTSTAVATVSGWRATARYVGTTANEARWAELKITDALDGLRLTVGGHVSTPIQHETTDSIQPDETKFSGLTAWTYAL